MVYALWKVLIDLGPALLPVLGLLFLLLSRVIWNHERRIRSLEQAKTRLGRSVYGDDDDINQAGLSATLQDVIDRLDRVEEKVDELHRDNNQ